MSIDAVTAPQFDDALRAAVANKPEGLVVDLTAVEFLASAGMGVLVAAHDDADDGTRFSVVADGPATSRPLKLVGIADIVPLYATLDDALRRIAKLDTLSRCVDGVPVCCHDRFNACRRNSQRRTL